MNLVYGTIVRIDTEEGTQSGTVRMSGALKKILLDLITDPKCGEEVLVCDNIAIGKAVERSPVNSAIRH